MMNHTKLTSLSLLLLPLLCTTPVAGWWDTGHMLTAAVALQTLPPAQVEEAALLLDMYHRNYPAASSFVSAAHWADDIKRNGDAYAFGGWHFIDFPYPNRDACSQDTLEEQNLVVALEGLRASLANTSSPAWSRAFSLRFIIHLVGDMHQPLHTVSRCSPAHPKGDAGGNLFKLTGTYSNLHKLWDAMGGQYADSIAKLCPYGQWDVCEKQEKQREAAVNTEAAALMKQFPKEAFENESFGPDVGGSWNEDILMGWARSSFDMVSGDARVYGAVTEHTKPDADYIAFVQATTRRRVVLGGYRLGRLLAENMPQSRTDVDEIENEKKEEARASAAEVAVVFLVLFAVALVGVVVWLVTQLRERGWSPSFAPLMCCKRSSGAPGLGGSALGGAGGTKLDFTALP